MTRNPAPPIDVRRLRAGEVALARAMNALFAEVFEAPDDYSARPPDDAYLVKLLGNDAAIALVALDGDTMVGALVAYELPKFEQARSEVYIYDLGVAATHRRRGVATALLARLLVWAWERSATHAYLQVDAENAPALAVYRKFGFATAYTYHYRGRPEERE